MQLLKLIKRTYEDCTEYVLFFDKIYLKYPKDIIVIFTYVLYILSKKYELVNMEPKPLQFCEICVDICILALQNNAAL